MNITITEKVKLFLPLPFLSYQHDEELLHYLWFHLIQIRVATFSNNKNVN